MREGRHETARGLRAWVCLGLAALLAALGGCDARLSLPYAHELEDTVLMRCLGVDVGTQGVDCVAVTAASGGRPSAGDSPGEAPVVLSAQADTVTAACAEMQTYGRDYVFYGDVDQVLVGEGLAQRSIRPLLELMAGDPELRLEASLWCVEGGSAADALFTGDAADRLSALSEDAELLSAGAPRTARAALADLTDNGCTYLPALTLAEAGPGQGEEGERRLTAGGYALFRDGALAGWAQGEAAGGVDLLLDRPGGELWAFTTPNCGRAALRLGSVRTSLSPVFEDGRLAALAVDCRLEAEAAEFRGTGELTQEDRAWLEGAVARAAEGRLRAAVALGQELGADFLHLGRRAALAAPWRKEALAEQWPGAFPGLELRVRVEATVARG